MANTRTIASARVSSKAQEDEEVNVPYFWYYLSMNAEDFASKIPENLSTIRKQQRYTQKEVAVMANLNPNYYAKVERGDGVPSLKTIHKLAKALKVTASEIVGF